MKPGPRKTPTAVLKMRGSWLADAPDRRESAQVEPARPTMPRWLKGEGKKCWQRLAPQLEAAGILTKLDGGLLSLYCQLYGEYVEALNLRGETPVIVKTTNGNIIQNPVVGVMHRVVDRLVRLGGELGLSPAARAGLKVARPVQSAGGLEKFQKTNAS